MGKSLNEMIAALPPERRRKVEARANELITEELTLRELRKALGRTQVEIAAALGVGQDAVSRYEQRSDMLISTLRDYIRKLGGELVLTAVFPGREPVRIQGFTVAEPSEARDAYRQRARHGKATRSRSPKRSRKATRAATAG